MELREAITSRRSIRSFLDRKVDRSFIEGVLADAVCAPSSGNSQPWRFVVLDDPGVIERSCRLNLDAYWGVHAPAAIVVCCNTGRHRPQHFWVQDCAAVTQNILLLLHASGLGATWTGVYPEESRVSGLREILHLPESMTPFSLVLLGYPKQKGIVKEHSLKDRVHYNRFGTISQTRYSYTSPARRRTSKP